jgi:hypothetical protein
MRSEEEIRAKALILDELAELTCINCEDDDMKQTYSQDWFLRGPCSFCIRSKHWTDCFEPKRGLSFSFIKKMLNDKGEK